MTQPEYTPPSREPNRYDDEGSHWFRFFSVLIVWGICFGIVVAITWGMDRVLGDRLSDMVMGSIAITIVLYWAWTGTERPSR
jgi:predicted membrane protein